MNSQSRKEEAMGWPVKVYTLFEDGKAKMRIPVFEVQPRCYSAVMVPIDPNDEVLATHLSGGRIRHELGETVESAAKTCENWIKANLWKDVYPAEEPER